ncbi:MAG: hypothetical protein JWR38_527 [Mucilaginibacter sp.]|nr:hypothetical protein [Mucilaginibacter sp.]
MDKYLGISVTEESHIRQELLSKGRYDEAKGNKKRAY